MDIREEALQKHSEWKGKIEIKAVPQLKTPYDLALAYTPGVAEPCMAIKNDYEKSFELTRRGNLVAVISDGTAVLGLGDIGAEAGMPVMEGKCALFKTFADVDAVPICIRSKDVDEIVRTIYLISGSFGGINLEDISAPRCFEIEKRLRELCDIPVFHDDQHGTAIVTAAAVINAMRFIKKEIKNVRAVINGAGSAGIAIAKLLLHLGIGDIIMLDTKGVLDENSPHINLAKKEMCRLTNKSNVKGDLATAIKGADLFIGVSVADVLTADMVKTMNKDAVVFALANPVPEIMPDIAKKAGARIVGTGRSDFPNQINNVLAFPGVFRGVFDCKAKEINNDMNVAASYAIANFINDQQLSEERILPDVLDKKLSVAVARAVVQAAVESGVARIKNNN
ncbi:MAG: NADP-dependent malic enzyme [Acutalibacteraceae bacterium]|nr:NADP-dependent malic enzyme [Acutalibacteraceae bacterium]